VGDGWGCSGTHEMGGSRWRCWTANRPETLGKPILAHDVPWLATHIVFYGRDRICVAIGDAGEARCWAEPVVQSAPPGDLPPNPWHWGIGKVLVGGTFTCATRVNIWSCTGDDTFGQLGKAGQTVGYWGTAGMWHACLRQTSGEIYCWGRGEGGQLGSDPPDLCRDGSRRIPCSRAPRPVRYELPEQSALRAGDMFTCAGLVCWGASRDGMFGKPAACPPELKKAWPTPNGPVPAPRASCSKAPVPVPELAGKVSHLTIGPRGMCAVIGEDFKPPPGASGLFRLYAGRAPPKRQGDPGHLRCIGAIKTPAAEVRTVIVSPGIEPSACGIVDSKVVCWGAGYSPADDPSALVTIEHLDVETRRP
jgi:hypothetical protein